MKKFTLINKNRLRIKLFGPFEDVLNSLVTLMKFWFLMVEFLSVQLRQLSIAHGLNLSGKRENNIKAVRWVGGEDNL